MNKNIIRLMDGDQINISENYISPFLFILQIAYLSCERMLKTLDFLDYELKKELK